MIPLRDANPVNHRPVVVYMLVALNVVVWFYEVSLGPGPLQEFLYRYGVVARALTEGNDLGSWITPVTSMFLHGGWFHVIGNLWFLWVFGDNIEDQLGSFRFVVFYLVCGLAAVAAQVYVDPTSSVPMVGASGAISGVMGAYVVMFPKARVMTLVPIFFFLQVFSLPAFLFIFVWFGTQLLSGVASLSQVGMNIGGTAFFAHIGGFVAGVAWIFLFGRGGRKKRVYHRRRQPYGGTGHYDR